MKEEEHGNLYLFRGIFMHKYQSVSKIEIIMVILWNICVGDFFFVKSVFSEICVKT